jgi:hypothetical protein
MRSRREVADRRKPQKFTYKRSQMEELMRTCILALATAALFAILTAAFSENIYLDLAIANSCQQR